MDIIGIGVVLDICYHFDILPKELTMLIIEYNYTILNKRPYKNIVPSNKQIINILEFIDYSSLGRYDSYRNFKKLNKIYDYKKTINIPQTTEIYTTKINDHVLDLCEKYDSSVQTVNTRRIQYNKKKKPRKYKKRMKRIYDVESIIKYSNNNKFEDPEVCIYYICNGPYYCT